ncbi:hypothetical protein HAX54_031944 [Datura stramonium]|uniref:MHD domain-containing protein n=1 Tax=Datura stramonium TaxID=4076 RepID=A0ABS8SC93_DATST|nr:hypothetical protein [Datura stramonium]
MDLTSYSKPAEWFPPSRALMALSAFRQTRLAFSKQPQPPTSDYPSDPSMSLGDDPLAASSGQVLLVLNQIWLLITVFECISIVNQAVSVVVTACRGVDVTLEKLAKKYAEIYMALDIVLRGVSNIRLAAMLASGARGKRLLEAGDVRAATLAITGGERGGRKLKRLRWRRIHLQQVIRLISQNLGGDFKKDKGNDSLDVAKALAGFDVTTLPPKAAASQSTHRAELPKAAAGATVLRVVLESLLARVGLMGTVYLRTLPPKSSDDKETEFSFKAEDTAAVKSLLPRLTPLPLRIRIEQRLSGTLLLCNATARCKPDIPVPLTNVTFILKLPVDPTLLKVSPKAVLNRSERELKWHVDEIPPKGHPGN